MDINVIPNNMEKYMAFIIGKNLTFIDSFQFMSQSLSSIANNLPTEAFKYTSQEFRGKKFELMKQKGVYPYDYMDSFDKFNKTLPAKEDVFTILNILNIFENFRSTCLQYYKLDPAHYFTSPGLSWDAMLKMTDIKLKLICFNLLKGVCDEVFHT